MLVLWYKRKSEKRPKCFYCGVVLVFTRDLPLPPNLKTNDHIYPRSKGGKDGKENIVPACLACNQAKASITLDVFRRQLTGKRDGRFHGELMYENRLSARQE